jgi:hypothetical protein
MVPPDQLLQFEPLFTVSKEDALIWFERILVLRLTLYVGSHDAI